MNILPRLVLLALVPLAAGAKAPSTAPTVHPTDAEPIFIPAPIGQTTPVDEDGDSADDPAIWVHPTDPDKSLVLCTDKHGGVRVYDLGGQQLQEASDATRPDNVDVLYGFNLGGKLTDLAVALCRAKDAENKPVGGLKIWAIEPQTRTLADVTAGNSAPVQMAKVGSSDVSAAAGSFIRVFDIAEGYGSTVYRSAKSGKAFVFVNEKHGKVEQYELIDSSGKVGAKLVRSFAVGSIVEGCVCDDERGLFYLSEETVGIWKFDAEPDGSPTGTLIARVGEHGLTADVEGLTLYLAPGGKGYLIASSQGSNCFKVYDRISENAFVATIDPVAAAVGGQTIGDVEETDGIAVTSAPCGPRFPRGLMVIQDGHNEPERQNFKFYRWEDVAGGKLLVDPSPARP